MLSMNRKKDAKWQKNKQRIQKQAIIISYANVADTTDCSHIKLRMTRCTDIMVAKAHD